MFLRNLPVHLLVEEIFTKLPVKSLIILTSVCKSWLALISSRSFVQAHLSRYQLNPNNHLLLLHHPWLEKAIISPINFSGIPSISLTPIPLSANRIRLSETQLRIFWPSSRILQSLMQTFVGPINGLVCFFRPIHKSTNVVIWNPATRRFKDILLPRLNIREKFKTRVAFGFDCVVNDYKIVCIYSYGFESNLSCRFRMYSCDDNSWKELKPDFPLHLGFIECVTVKGNPYWRCLRKQAKHLNEILVKVDVQTEVVQMFSALECHANNETTLTSIMDLGDSVGLAVFSPGAESNDMVHVYTLEENSGVWLRMYTIESIGVHGLQITRILFKCYMNGKLIFISNQNKLYDLTSKELKDLAVVDGKENQYNPINYTESLVAIEGMESVREEAAKEERQDSALATNDRNASDATM